MNKELSPESNVGDLVDYLLEKRVDIRISVPDDYVPSLEIRVACADAYGKHRLSRNGPIRCIKYIDLNQYKCAPPELRNMIITQTIHELIESLERS